jgi:uncharacterized radical SAM superfamily Fe-S cluster-containing enzyme
MTATDPAPTPPAKVERNEVFVEYTKSICPVCKVVVDGQVNIREDKVYLRKRCKEHGTFEALVYGDAQMYVDSARFNKPGTIPLTFQTEVKDGCPSDCGRCPVQQHQPHRAGHRLGPAARQGQMCRVGPHHRHPTLGGQGQLRRRHIHAHILTGTQLPVQRRAATGHVENCSTRVDLGRQPPVLVGPLLPAGPAPTQHPLCDSGVTAVEVGQVGRPVPRVTHAAGPSHTPAVIVSAALW